MPDNKKVSFWDTWQGFDKTTNVHKTTYSDTPHPCIGMEMGGLSSDAFDGEDQPHFKMAGFICSVARVHAILYPLPEQKDVYFMDWQKVCSGDIAFFTSWTEITLTKAYYDLHLPKWRVYYQLKLGEVGACGVTFKGEMFAIGDDGTKHLIWTNLFQWIFVDMKVRSVARTPKWFLDKYKGRGCFEKLQVNRPFRKANVTYIYPIRVAKQDEDKFGHATWSSYVEWVTDAVRAAIKEKSRQSKGSKYGGSVEAITNLNTKIVSRGLAKTKVTYFKECLVGDLVTLHLWQDKSEPDAVFASVVKDGEEICGVKVWYWLNEQ